MSDFNSWKEVEEWLSDPEDKWQSVSYGSWTWTGLYMSCHSDSEYGPCCQDDYETYVDAVEAIKDYSSGNLGAIRKQ